MRKLPILFFLLAFLLFTNCSTENTPIYTLTTNVNPSEAGSVSPSTGEYDEGTEVELTATPNEHWYPPDELHIAFKVLRVQLPDVIVPGTHDVLQGVLKPLVGIHLMCFARSEEHTSELQSRGHLVCR